LDLANQDKEILAPRKEISQLITPANLSEFSISKDTISLQFDSCNVNLIGDVVFSQLTRNRQNFENFKKKPSIKSIDII
jgi:hypothetical protein